jgi:shikimate kinase
MYKARIDIYENIADVIIDTDGKTVEAIAKEIINYLLQACR